MPEMKWKTIMVTSGYGYNTRQPFVQIQDDRLKEPIQLSPEEARDLALNLLEAAEASETEEPMWKKIAVVDETFNNYVEVYRVPSDTIWNAAYVVAKTAQGEWNCSCPDWIYRRPEGGCKHMLYVEMWKQENNIPTIATPAASVELSRFAALDL